MPKPNAMLAKIEEKYRREYELRLNIAERDFRMMLDMVLQQSADAAIMAIDDVFDVNETSAKKFHDAHVAYVNKIAHMAVVEDKDDREMAWTKETIDRRLKQIVGTENFVPWDGRYLCGENEGRNADL